MRCSGSPFISHQYYVQPQRGKRKNRLAVAKAGNKKVALRPAERKRKTSSQTCAPERAAGLFSRPIGSREWKSWPARGVGRGMTGRRGRCGRLAATSALKKETGGEGEQKKTPSPRKGKKKKLSPHLISPARKATAFPAQKSPVGKEGRSLGRQTKACVC